MRCEFLPGIRRTTKQYQYLSIGGKSFQYSPQHPLYLFYFYINNDNRLIK